MDSTLRSLNLLGLCGCAQSSFERHSCLGPWREEQAGGTLPPPHQPLKGGGGGGVCVRTTLKSLLFSYNL